MTSVPVRFGIIGAGVAAETHARELAAIDNARLAAVYARSEQKAAAFAAAFSVPKHFSSLAHFLTDPELDAIIITSPNALHLEHALASASAGKHVIVEKPLEITRNRADRIVEACQRAGVSLFVIYQRVYSSSVQQARADILAGKLGNVFMVNLIDNQYRAPAYYQNDAWRGTRQFEGGGCVITQSTHLIDLAQYLLGPVSSLYASTATVMHNIETEDAAVAILHFAGGVLGTLSSSTAAYPGLRHLIIINGTQGSLIINGEYDQILFRQTRDEGVTHAAPQNFTFADTQNPRDYPTQGQRRQLQAITDRLAQGEVNIDERALLSVSVVEGIYRSAEGRRTVTL